jgi:putative ABC transport system permease protein
MKYDPLFSLRYALRSLSKQLTFSFVVLLILALGIGAETVIFSLAYNVLLRPLGYFEPERLVELWPEDYVDKLIATTVVQEGRAFDSVSPYQGAVFSLSGSGDPASVKGAKVGTAFFQVLRARPLLGRSFSPEESRPGQNRVVVLSHALWRARYGADRNILTRSVSIDGVAHRIIGVMPADFHPLEPGWQVWTPLPVDPGDVKDFQGSFYLKLLGRLKPGVTARQAAENLQALCQSLRATYPELMTNEKIAAATAVPLQEYLVKDVRPILLFLLGAVGLVLLIVCGNVATLLLARTLRRRGELAIRAALGAGRAQLIRDAVTESLVLGLLGGAAGLLLAQYGLTLLPRLLPLDLPRAGEVGIDGPVLVFNLLTSFLAALVFSLWPIRRALRLELLSELKVEGGGSVGRESRRFGRALVTLQVAMSVVLLLTAGLLLESLWRLQNVRPGFQPANLLSLRLDLPGSRYSEPSRMADYYHRILTEVGAVPGVAGLGAIQLLPLTAENWSFPYLAQDHPSRPGEARGAALPEANFRVVTPGYFETVGIRLQEGRFFNDGDGAKAPSVGLINHTLAEKLWPGKDPLGKKISHFGNGGPSFTVIGVVEDVHQHRLDQDPKPEIYRPFDQWPVNSMYLLVRTRLQPETLIPSLRATIWRVDPEIPIADLQPVGEVLRESMRNERSTGFLITIFAIFALLLAMIGLYGIVSYTVSQRSREIEIRMALGAQRGHVLRAIVSEGLALTLIGLVLGFAIALLNTRLLASRLYQTSATDWTILVPAAALILASALASSWIPARRATRLALPKRSLEG